MIELPNISDFTYQEDKVIMHKRLEYIKSNIDGSNTRIVSVYLPSPTEIEVIKIRNGNIDAPLVLATMDYSIFSATKLHSYWVFKDKPMKDQADLNYDNSENNPFFNATRYFYDDSEPQDISFPSPSPPFHFYNFDVISFNMTLPHLKEEKKTSSFSINLVDLRPDANGIMKCEYLTEENYKGRICRKYKISGSAFNDALPGHMWVDKDNDFLINFEHPVPDNDSWNSFKMEFQNMESMSPSEWEKWWKNEIQTKLVEFPNN